MTAAPTKPAATLGWAFYVAVSWTWCIGMFLPVILLRDFGYWGSIAFAIPNILGAASVGFVMKSPDSSRRLLTEHAAAVKTFSAVTIAFQVFFAAWIWSNLGGWQLAPAWLAPAAAAIVLCILPGRFRPVWLAISVAVWVLSAVVLIKTISITDLQKYAWFGILPTHEVWPMALVCALGFGACPYLDATFHRARIETGGSSKAAFSLGFGLLFPIMILGTLAVAPLLLPMIHGTEFLPAAMLVLSAHIVPQLLFTVRAHALESPWNPPVPNGRVGAAGEGLGCSAVASSASSSWRSRLPLALIAAATLGAVVALHPLTTKVNTLTLVGMPLGMLIYRLFLGFYGLGFPAYVLICILPINRDGVRVNLPKPRLYWCFAAVALATPFYWLAFIERQTWWVVLGIVIVLAAMIGARESVRRAGPQG